MEYIQSIISNKNNILCGSALEFSKLDIPQIDFSITSPPYMSKSNHAEYPFAGYQITGDGYEQYLSDIYNIYKQLKTKLKSGAYVVLEISNIINNGILTTLAWDVAKSVSKVLTLEKDIIIEWENEKESEKYGFGYDHNYCLIFKNE